MHHRQNLNLFVPDAVEERVWKLCVRQRRTERVTLGHASGNCKTREIARSTSTAKSFPTVGSMLSKCRVASLSSRAGVRIEIVVHYLNRERNSASTSSP